MSTEPTGTSTTPPEPTDPGPAQETDWEAKAAELQREARKWEERAKANKAAADKLAELEEANKTELQKALDRAEAAEQALAAKEAEALRLTIAAKHGITGDYLDLLHGADEAELEARAVKIAALIKPSEPERKGALGPYVPPEGTGGGTPGTTGDLFAAAVEQVFN